jgi:hypothetical protein
MKTLIAIIMPKNKITLHEATAPLNIRLPGGKY